jgi:hypothetical protein
VKRWEKHALLQDVKEHNTNRPGIKLLPVLIIKGHPLCLSRSNIVANEREFRFYIEGCYTCVWKTIAKHFSVLQELVDTILDG